MFNNQCWQQTNKSKHNCCLCESHHWLQIKFVIFEHVQNIAVILWETATQNTASNTQSCALGLSGLFRDPGVRVIPKIPAHTWGAWNSRWHSNADRGSTGDCVIQRAERSQPTACCMAMQWYSWEGCSLGIWDVNIQCCSAQRTHTHDWRERREKPTRCA